MKFKFFPLSLLFVFVCARDVQARKLAFDELPSLVESRNEMVEAANLNVTAQRERTGIALRSFLPQFNVVLGGEQFKTGSAPSDSRSYWKIESSLNLYHGGRDSIEGEIRNSNLDLAKIGRISEFQNELKEARQSFWKALAIAKLVSEKKEAIERNEAFLQSARRRANADVTTTADASEFEIHKVALQREQRKLEHEYDVVLNRLSVAIALDEHENIDLVGDFPNVAKLPPLQDLGVPNLQLSVRTSRTLQKTEELKAAQSSRWWLPKLDLYASYGVPSLSDEYSRALRGDREWTAGVKVGFDFGQGLEARRESASRHAQAKSLERRAAHATREAIAFDHELRHELSILTELIANADTDVARAQKFLKLTESEYTRGVKNGPDLLDAFRKYFEIRERRIENHREYFEIRSELESLIAGSNANPTS